MKIVYITAGAGGLDCEACAHDALLIEGLRSMGHSVVAPTLYTPSLGRSSGPIFYGGINVFLQQRYALFRKTPRLLDWMFDRPSLLRLLSHIAISIEPEELGEMTVSVLRGESGCQRKELNRLVDYLARMSRQESTKPDAVLLPNSLLVSLAPALKQRVNIPVLCVLQGEEGFIASMPEPYAAQAQALIREHSRSIDFFVSPGEAYTAEMAGFLAVDRSRVRTVRTGIDTAVYANPAPRRREPFRIGYLSDVNAAKGIDVLVEAFRILTRKTSERMILTIAREVQKPQRQFWASLYDALKGDGLADRIELCGTKSEERDADILRTCSVVCVPSPSVERHGMVCLKALACGIPLVTSDMGVFPEIIGLTGGGIAVRAGEPEAFAAAIDGLRADPDRADRLGRAGAESVAKHYTLRGMTERVLDVAGEAMVRSSAGSP